MPHILPAPVFNFELRWSLTNKLGIDLREHKKLLSDILDITTAEVISTYKTNLVTSYILTKSSLFVSRDQILLVTCHESDPTLLGDKLGVAATDRNQATKSQIEIINLSTVPERDMLDAINTNNCLTLNSAPDFGAITSLLSQEYYIHSHCFTPDGFSINAISERSYKAIHYYHEPKKTLTVTGRNIGY